MSLAVNNWKTSQKITPQNELKRMFLNFYRRIFFQLRFNPISREISSRARSILNENLLREENRIGYRKTSFADVGFPAETPLLFRRVLEMDPGIFTSVEDDASS